jgi:hypothetical protein
MPATVDATARRQATGSPRPIAKNDVGSGEDLAVERPSVQENQKAIQPRHCPQRDWHR